MAYEKFLTVLVMSFCAIPHFVFATVPAVYTNENYLNSMHEEPVDFFHDGQGGFYGHTTSGRLFTQTVITNTHSFALQKFSIDKAFFYITDKGTFFATDDLAAVSIYLLMV